MVLQTHTWPATVVSKGAMTISEGEMDAPKGLMLIAVGATEIPVGEMLMPVAPTETACGLATMAQGA